MDCLSAARLALPSFDSVPEGGITVTDPIFGFELPAEQLTDQFHEVVMSSDEIERIRHAKCEHPYMGRMAFPDDLAKPARTVVATQLGRETLVLAAPGGRYRRATVRECASLQSFPITYQFHGTGLSGRYRLVGDAVPPLLSFAIAAEIVRQETGTYPTPLLRTAPARAAARATADFSRTKRKQSFPPSRKYCALVPGKEVPGWRAEFDNQGKTAARSDKVSDFVPIWQARLYTGEGKQTLRVYSVPLPQALAELALASDLGSVVTPDALLAFVDSLCVEFNGVPDARTLQARWTERAHGPGPNELVAAMRSIVDLHFPAVRFANMRLRSSCIIPDRSARGLRLRSAAGLVAAALVAERVNRPERVLGGARDLLDPVLATPEKTRQLVLI